MNSLKLRNILFPIALLSFTAVGVSYIGIVFNPTTRWLFLGILLIFLLLRGEIAGLFRTKTGIVIIVYLIWCLCTTAWSEAPELSLLKSLALVLVAVTLFCAGQAWSVRNASLAFLLPTMCLTLFAGFGGSVNQAGTIEVYEGLAGNSNYLGAIVGMSMPCAIWLAYSTRQKRVRYLLSLGAVALLFVILWRAASRASMLCVLMTLGGFVLALNPRKRVMAFVAVAFVGVGATIVLPVVQSSLYERFIVKGNVTDEEGAAFVTRQEVWAESWDQALQGGMIGGGYGVTIGSTEAFSIGELGLSAVGYGREKGNTQLAIWEETGLIGLGLYAACVLGFILELGAALVKARDPERKMRLGLLLGVLVGFTVQSFFEAWWVAPGSAESAFFWATLGSAYGTIKRSSPVKSMLRQPPFDVKKTRISPSLSARL